MAPAPSTPVSERGAERARLFLLAALVGDDLPALGPAARAELLAMVAHPDRLFWDELWRDPLGCAAAAFSCPDLTDWELRELVRAARRLPPEVLLESLLLVPGRDRLACELLWRYASAGSVRPRSRALDVALGYEGPRTRTAAMVVSYLGGGDGLMRAAAELSSCEDSVLEVFAALVRDDRTGAGRVGWARFEECLTAARLLAVP